MSFSMLNIIYMYIGNFSMLYIIYIGNFSIFTQLSHLSYFHSYSVHFFLEESISLLFQFFTKQT